MKKYTFATLLVIASLFFNVSHAGANSGSFFETAGQAQEAGIVRSTTDSASTTPANPTTVSPPKTAVDETAPSYVCPTSTTTVNKQVNPYKGQNTSIWLPERFKNATVSVLRSLIASVFGVQVMCNTWPQYDMWWVYKTLYSLPKSYVKYIKTINRAVSYMGSKNILGYMYSNTPRMLVLCGPCFNYGRMAGTLVHEMAHCLTFQRPDLADAWVAAFYKDGRYRTSPPTSYGTKNMYEDLAESVKCYWLDGEGMKAKCPDRYEFVKKYFMDGYEYRNNAPL